MNIKPQEIVEYWFSDRVKKQWFSSSTELDKEIEEKYEALWEKAKLGELDPTFRAF